MGPPWAGALAALCLVMGSTEALRTQLGENVSLPRSRVDDHDVTGGMLPIPSKICRRKPCFILRRISKAAGTYVTRLLQQVVHEDYLTIGKDDIRVDPDTPYVDTRRDNFVVGTIRNPCSMSLSLARHSPEKPFLARSIAGSARLSPGFNASEFKRWVDASTVGGVGYQSYFFWMSYLQPECLLPPKQDPFEVNPQHCVPEHMKWDLANLRPEVAADCWVRKESVLPDVRVCLERFQQLHPGEQVVDWRAFDAIAKGAAEVVLPGRYAPSAAKEEQCNEIFQDPETEALIRRVDVHLFTAFGYRRCCLPSERP